MKMFEMLDKLYKKNLDDEYYVPVEEPKNCQEKYSDIKEYKRQYYLKNLEKYKERNKKYRTENKKEILRKAREKRNNI